MYRDQLAFFWEHHESRQYVVHLIFKYSKQRRERTGWDVDRIVSLNVSKGTFTMLSWIYLSSNQCSKRLILHKPWLQKPHPCHNTHTKKELICGALKSYQLELQLNCGWPTMKSSLWAMEPCLIRRPTISANQKGLIFTLEYFVAIFCWQPGLPWRKLADEIRGTELPSSCNLRQRCSFLHGDWQVQWFLVFEPKLPSSTLYRNEAELLLPLWQTRSEVLHSNTRIISIKQANSTNKPPQPLPKFKIGIK